jgi:polysaccharide deacetylase family sporulation protein PdaB
MIAVKMFVITKRKLIQVAVAVVLAIGLIAGVVVLLRSGAAETFSLGSARQPQIEEYELEVNAAARRELPIYNVGREDKKIALTIDAAWEADKTDGILEILEKEGIKSTWFLCGYWVENCPEEVKKLHEQGHVIGNHSATHPHMSKMSAGEIAEDLKAMDDKLEKVTGVRSTLFRAPYGEYDDNVIKTARGAGYEVIQWDVDTVDWKDERTVEQIYKRVMDNVKSGSIILCHNNAKHVLEYMPLIIQDLKSQGYEFVTVPELLLQGEFTIDNNGTMQPKGEAS